MTNIPPNNTPIAPENMPVAPENTPPDSPLAQTEPIGRATPMDDPVLDQVVTLFVAEMPKRLERLMRDYHANRDQLQQSALQLKDAAGDCGFDEIALLAERLEVALRKNLTEANILQTLVELIELCRSKTLPFTATDGSSAEA